MKQQYHCMLQYGEEIRMTFYYSKLYSTVLITGGKSLIMMEKIDLFQAVCQKCLETLSDNLSSMKILNTHLYKLKQAKPPA